MTKKEAKSMCRLERDARQTLEQRKARAFDWWFSHNYQIVTTHDEWFFVADGQRRISDAFMGKLEAVEDAMKEATNGR